MCVSKPFSVFLRSLPQLIPSYTTVHKGDSNFAL